MIQPNSDEVYRDRVEVPAAPLVFLVAFNYLSSLVSSSPICFHRSTGGLDRSYIAALHYCLGSSSGVEYLVAPILMGVRLFVKRFRKIIASFSHTNRLIPGYTSFWVDALWSFIRLR